MADQEYEPDWEVTLRRAGPGSGDGGNTGMYEVICGKCGDNPALDYGEVSAGLRRNGEPHDPAGETAASRPARSGTPGAKGR